MGPIGCPRHPPSINSANGIRTRVWALRGPRPSPLDDSAENHCELRTPNQLRTICEFSLDRPGGNRTPNRRFWRPVLYQLSYGPTMGWLTGIEPATPGATVRCSNQLSYSHHRTACILTAFYRRINLLGAVHVLARIWIHSHLFARADELRNVDGYAVLELRRLGRRGLGRRLHHRRGIDHREHH
jgi:hypothetical protein